MNSHIEVNYRNAQQRLKTLYQQRKDVIKNIKITLYNKKTIDQSFKQQSLQGQRPVSAKKQSEQSLIKKQQSLKQHHTHLNTSSEQVKKVIELQSNLKDRNKRLLGGLNSHLKSAGESLKRQESKLKLKLDYEQKIVQKQREQNIKNQQQKLKAIEEDLEKLMDKKKKCLKQIFDLENTILKNKFIAFVSDLSSSNPNIFTKNQPEISWMPYKHNENTQKALENQAIINKTQDEKIIELIKNQSLILTPNKVENDRQQFTNILQSFYKSNFRFILTKNEPTLPWKPHTLNDRLKETYRSSIIKLLQRQYSKMQRIKEDENAGQEKQNEAMEVFSDSESDN